MIQVKIWTPELSEAWGFFHIPLSLLCLWDLRIFSGFCNLNVSCSLSCNANKLPAHKLLTSLCIFISDGQQRVWMPTLKTKRIKRVCCFIQSTQSPGGLNATLTPVRRIQESPENTARLLKSLPPPRAAPSPRHPQGWNPCLHYTHTSRVVYQPFAFKFNLKPAAPSFTLTQT